MPSSRSSGVGRVAFTVFYVIPLLASAVALWAVGLPELALALVAVEACVLAAMAAVRRRPAGAIQPSRARARPWLVPALMVGALLAMTGIAVLAARGG